MTLWMICFQKKTIQPKTVVENIDIDSANRKNSFRPLEWVISYEEGKAESCQLKESDDTCGVLNMDSSKK
ncbi:hypothetical protein NBRC13296_24110 [Paenibacillus chitinolyticus]|uniref:hypothetical protein n=1 Tax=Paenibacillus chitinolyticus TaxID=79263 RepID=UPI003558375A